MLQMYTSKMLMSIVERGEREINMCYMTIFCTMLTSYVFQLVPFTFYFCSKRMEVV
jgi:hypothetical protein